MDSFRRPVREGIGSARAIRTHRSVPSGSGTVGGYPGGVLGVLESSGRSGLETTRGPRALIFGDKGPLAGDDVRFTRCKRDRADLHDCGKVRVSIYRTNRGMDEHAAT